MFSLFCLCSISSKSSNNFFINILDLYNSLEPDWTGDGRTPHTPTSHLPVSSLCTSPAYHHLPPAYHYATTCHLLFPVSSFHAFLCFFFCSLTTCLSTSIYILPFYLPTFPALCHLPLCTHLPFPLPPCTLLPAISSMAFAFSSLIRGAGVLQRRQLCSYGGMSWTISGSVGGGVYGFKYCSFV